MLSCLSIHEFGGEGKKKEAWRTAPHGKQRFPTISRLRNAKPNRSNFKRKQRNLECVIPTFSVIPISEVYLLLRALHVHVRLQYRETIVEENIESIDAKDRTESVQRRERFLG